MRFYVGVPTVALALLIGASGVAAVARGWVLPFNRGRVHRVHLYGWGRLVVAVALLTQGMVLLIRGCSAFGTTPSVSLLSSLLLLTGLLVMAAGQALRGGRRTG